MWLLQSICVVYTIWFICIKGNNYTNITSNPITLEEQHGIDYIIIHHIHIILIGMFTFIFCCLLCLLYYCYTRRTQLSLKKNEPSDDNITMCSQTLQTVCKSTPSIASTAVSISRYANRNSVPRRYETHEPYQHKNNNSHPNDMHMQHISHLSYKSVNSQTLTNMSSLECQTSIELEQRNYSLTQQNMMNESYDEHTYITSLQKPKVTNIDETTNHMTNVKTCFV
eukprot:519340_1